MQITLNSFTTSTFARYFLRIIFPCVILVLSSCGTGPQSNPSDNDKKASETGYTYKITGAENAKQEELKKIFSTLEATVLDGPSEQRIYTISIRAEKRDAERILIALQNSAAIQSVELK